ncbi:MAG: T9SS type A sorting domain-containing protein [Bacteroidota bacterium]
MNVESFAVERSKDGGSFSAIGTVPAKNGSYGNQYEFLDGLISPASYYRLRMIDKDGLFEFSPVLSVHNSAVNILKYAIYPNPITGNVLNIISSSTDHQDVVVTVTDVAGRIWLKQAIMANLLNSGKVVVPILSLPSGFYYLQIRGD